MEDAPSYLIDMTRVDIRRGYRNAGIGAAVGVGLYATLGVGISRVLGREAVGFRPEMVLIGAVFALIGAACGMMVSSARIHRRTREVMGSDSGTRHRIARVVLGGDPDPLSDDEQRRAARYAAIMKHSLPYNAVGFVAFYAAFLLFAVSDILFPPRGLAPHFLIDFLDIAFMVVMIAVVLARMLVRARRARGWVAMRASL
jgi:hypothetical protein